MVLSYSWSGTTTIMANLLADTLQTDRMTVSIPEDTFSNDMYQTSDIAKEQLTTGNLPTVKNNLSSINDYDVLLIGGPVWSGDVSTPIRSILKNLKDFKGKIAPFYTDAGSAGEYETEFKKIAHNNLAGLGMTASELTDPTQATIRIQEWLNKIIQ